MSSSICSSCNSSIVLCSASWSFTLHMFSSLFINRISGNPVQISALLFLCSILFSCSLPYKSSILTSLSSCLHCLNSMRFPGSDKVFLLSTTVQNVSSNLKLGKFQDSHHVFLFLKEQLTSVCYLFSGNNQYILLLILHFISDNRIAVVCSPHAYSVTGTIFKPVVLFPAS